jgi:hypothetical protein
MKTILGTFVSVIGTVALLALVKLVLFFQLSSLISICDFVYTVSSSYLLRVDL